MSLQETPQNASTASRNVASPLSPGALQRNRETEELRILNKRLKSYIKHMRSHNPQDVERMKDVFQKEYNDMKDRYEEEVGKKRTELEETKKLLAKAKTDKDRFQTEAQSNANRALKEAAQRKSLEDSVQKLQHAIEDKENIIRGLKEDIKNQQKELADAEVESKNRDKHIRELLDQLSAEKHRAHDLQARSESLADQLNFKVKIYEDKLQSLTDELDGLRGNSDDLETQLKSDFDERLANALVEARQKHENETEDLRQKLQDDARAAVAKKESEVQEYMANVTELAEVNDSLRADLERVKTRLTEAEARSGAAVARAKDLEQALDDERRRHAQHNNEHKADVDTLKRKLESEKVKFADLELQNRQLDEAIGYYRTLLEEEEGRLGIRLADIPASTVKRPHHQRVIDESVLSSIVRSYKRPRIEEELQAEVLKGDGDVTIDEVEPTGEFVRLVNNTDQDVDMSAWRLRAEGPGVPAVELVFPPGFLLAGSSFVTVATRIFKGAETEDVIRWDEEPTWAVNNGYIALQNSQDAVISSAQVEDVALQGNSGRCYQGQQ